METQMAETFVARVSATINASRAKVCDALADPETMKRYMPLTSVASDWRESSRIEGAQTHLSVSERGNTTEREL
jgi:uncharacterized protein YndB with AHSA1/START domain